MLVAKYVVNATNAGDDARPGEGAHPHATDADAGVFCRVRLQADRAQLVTAPRAEQVEPDSNRGENREDQREIRGRTVEVRVNVGKTRQKAGVYLRCMKRLRDVKVSGDEPVQE